MFIQLTRIDDKKQIRFTLAVADINLIDNYIEQTDTYTREHAKSYIRTYSRKTPIPVIETPDQINEALKAAGMLLRINTELM